MTVPMVFTVYLLVGQTALAVFIARWYLQSPEIRRARWSEGIFGVWLWAFAWPLMIYREFRRPAHD